MFNRQQRRAQAALNRYKKENPVSKRDRQAINNDYANTCAQIGERSFQISMMEADIDALKKRVLELGKEIKALDDEEQKAAKQTNPATAQPLTEVPVVQSQPEVSDASATSAA